MCFAKILEETNFTAILWGLIFILCLLIFYLLKGRKTSEAQYLSVNCWFCDIDQIVHSSHANSWTCSHCEQYNGFQEDGDYNRDIPEQYNSHLNSPSIPRGSWHARDASVLCAYCAARRRLYVLAIQNMEKVFHRVFPSREAVARDKEALESSYDLCSDCDSKVRHIIALKNVALSRQLSTNDFHTNTSDPMQYQKTVAKKIMQNDRRGASHSKYPSIGGILEALQQRTLLRIQSLHGLGDIFPHWMFSFAPIMILVCEAIKLVFLMYTANHLLAIYTLELSASTLLIFKSLRQFGRKDRSTLMLCLSITLFLSILFDVYSSPHFEVMVAGGCTEEGSAAAFNSPSLSSVPSLTSIIAFAVIIWKFVTGLVSPKGDDYLWQHTAVEETSTQVDLLRQMEGIDQWKRINPMYIVPQRFNNGRALDDQCDLSQSFESSVTVLMTNKFSFVHF
tara:strand:+ start:257 stop:1606 length:1350 start_codon:yes stop_codon:yes gene_type:complete